MHPFKKVLILVIILLTFFIIYNLLMSRKEIQIQGQKEQNQLQERELKEGFGQGKEGFGQGKEDDEVKNMKNTGPISITSIPPKYMDLPIREFIVKSSYNSALSGQYAGKEPIRVVLERGCRLLDFEIYTRDSIEYVSYSGDPEFKSMDTENEVGKRLSLGDAFNTVIGYSFTAPAPSPNDPLFISLRIKNNSSEAYSRIAMLIENAFPNRLFKGDVNSGTPLSELMGKVVIILDKTSSPDYKNYIKCESSKCFKLDNYINIESGTISLPKYTYSDLVTLSPKIVTTSQVGLRTDIDSFMMVTPLQVDQIKPPTPKKAFSTWHPQFLLYKFYKPSEELTEYEKIFNSYQCSFVPISRIVTKSYLKNSAR